MTIRRRSAVLGILVASLGTLYVAAKLNSPYLVEYIVEKTLIQKVPPGTDPVRIHESLEELLATAPNRQAKLEMLFRISGQLEKVQELDPKAVEEILASENADAFIR
jgi:hypothetical protein